MTTQLTSLFDQLQQRRTAVFIVLGLLTAALAVPFLALAPETSASNEPTGDIFTARDRIDEAFVSSTHSTFIIAEHESGDVLTAEALNELFAMGNALRSDPQLGTTLFSFYDDQTETDVIGLRTIADLIDAELQTQGSSLPQASTAEVKATTATLIDRFGLDLGVLGLSAQTTQNEAGE